MMKKIDWSEICSNIITTILCWSFFIFIPFGIIYIIIGH